MARWNRKGALRSLAGIALAWCAACGGSSGGMGPGGASPTLKLASSTRLGNYLVDGNGRALYYFTKDLPAGGGNPAVSNCTGSASDPNSCVSYWPIFHADSIVVQGIDAADVGQITRSSDGIRQTTYKGWPLYYFKSDTNPGDVNGEAVPDWFVLRNPFYTVMIVTDSNGTDRLTDGAGRSLYTFNLDTAGTPPASACDGVVGDRTTCVGNWPVFLASATVVPSSIDPTRFTVFTRPDNTQQSAFDGNPLYYFADDAIPGDVKGLTFPPGLGHWFNVDPAAR